MTALQRLETERASLDRTRIVSEPLPTPRDGEALLAIDRVALTANNITYAAFGDAPALRYWSFFPTHDRSFGHMPAWGFANVVHSTVAGLDPGERFYGYWPIASHLTVRPVRVTERGFYDGTEHRQELTSAYNQYARVRTDAAYRAEYEDLQILLRPLFITSFMLADYLEDHGYFGAEQLLVSSASSKTAFGTAFCLDGTSARRRCVALTSARNREFVSGLGCYDTALTYDALETLDRETATLYVDFSGDAALRERVHRHFGAALVHDCSAGSAQSHDPIGVASPDLPGPRPVFYFAPTQIKKRNADWGPAEVTRRFNEAQLAFFARVADPSEPWMRVVQHAGLGAAQTLIRDLVSGAIDPTDGHVVRLHGPADPAGA